MKYIVKFLMAAFLISAAASCSEDMKYEPGGATPVKQLLAPADNYYAELQSKATEAVRFAWTPAFTEDGANAMYELVFMKSANGEVLSRYSGGVNTSATISHKDINKIAGAVGIKTGTTGDLYWTVVSTDRLGVSTPITAKPHCLTIKRLNGFEDIPEQLYLLGDGTDAGDKPLRCLESRDGEKLFTGEYTVYAKLEAGKTYYFASTIDEGKTPRTFAIDENGILAETATPTTVEKSGVYRLYLDFNTRANVVTEIKKVQLFQCSQNKSFQDFTYEGRGVWVAVDMKTETGDDRYLFHTWTGAGDWNEKWASKNWDNSAPGAGSAADFWSIYPQTDRLGDAWGYSFKWIHAEWDTKKTVDVRIVMNVDNYEEKPFFYHEVSYK